MHCIAKLLLVLWLSLAGTPASFAADSKLLHSFAGKPDGRNPYGSVALSGDALYGMTGGGGEADGGIVYRINTDGSDYAILRYFSGGREGGRNPGWCTPTVTGSHVYGITSDGGEFNGGTIFTIAADGKGFQTLHALRERLLTKDGTGPQGKLALGGSTLYGTTNFGGLGGKGTVYKMETDGSGFKVLHAFSGGPKDGDTPLGSLLVSGSALFGMTQIGGFHDLGTIYTLDCRGGGFSLLHSFSGGSADGDCPHGGLVLDADTLYGMTSNWKTNHFGAVFKIKTDGSGFQVLHAFQRGRDDGRFPYGGLLPRGSALYGMTSGGGTSDRRTVFKVGIDGGGFEIVHSFVGDARDGSYPCGDLAGNGSKLYGMTYTSGAGGRGTVFSVDLPEPF